MSDKNCNATQKNIPKRSGIKNKIAHFETSRDTPGCPRCSIRCPCPGPKALQDCSGFPEFLQYFSGCSISVCLFPRRWDTFPMDPGQTLLLVLFEAKKRVAKVPKPRQPRPRHRVGNPTWRYLCSGSCHNPSRDSRRLSIKRTPNERTCVGPPGCP